MSRWACPACDREFGRARQSHVCLSGYFTGLAGPCGGFQTQADMATLGACTTSTSW
jgi:hypothetical protein